MKSKSSQKHSRFIPGFALAILGSAGPTAQAADIYKAVADANSFGLNSGSHWPGDIAPTAGNNYFSSYLFRWNGDTATFAGDSLTLNSGGSLTFHNANSGTATFNNGGLILNGGSIDTWGWGSVTANIAGNLTVASQSAIQFNTSATFTHNIQSTITGSGLLAVFNNNDSTLGSTAVLSGNNSAFSGGFNVGMNSTQARNANTVLKVNHANALGTGILTMTWGTVDLNNFNPVVSALNGSNAAGNFVQNNATGTSTLTVGDSQNRDSSYAGVLRDGGAGKVLALTKAGNGTLTLGGLNAYTGATTVNGGVLRIASGGAIYSTHNNLATINVNTGGTIEFAGGWGWGSTNAFGQSNNDSLTVNGGTLRYIGQDGTSGNRRLTVGASGATLDSGTAGKTWGLNQGVLNSSGGLLTLTGVGNGSIAAIPGTGGLTKNGAGTWTLTAVNGYSGATTINGGTLAVTGSGSINNTSSITVAAGARFNYNSSVVLTRSVSLDGGPSNRAVLGGSGPINAVVSLDNVNDVLSPGDSPGIMSLGISQTWSSFSYDWEVNDFTGTVAGTAFDQIAITGILNLNGGNGSYVLNLISLTSGNFADEAPNFSEINRTWNIITTTGGITGFNVDNWTINAAGFSNPDQGFWSLNMSGGNLILSYNAIPEPAAAILGSIGMVLLLRRRRD